MYAASAPPPPAGPPGAYDQRATDVGDMTSYMMGLTLNGAALVDQRAGGDSASRNDGPSPHAPGAPQTPQLMMAANGSYYWGPQISSQNQGYAPTVMYYYPPNNVPSQQSASGIGLTTVSASNNSSNYNRGTSPSANTRENSNNKSNANSSGAGASSSTGSSHRNSYNRNVAASYAKGAAIYQPPVYSMPNMPAAPLGQERTVINGYPNDCVAVGAPQQQVVYTVSSMHTSTVPTQSYQPSVYSSASALTAAGSTQPSTLTYYQGVPGGGDSSVQSQAQQLVPMSPYAGPQGYIPAPGTPPLTPQASYGVHPYVYGMYSQTPSGPGGPTSPAAYSNVAPHQSPMIQRMMRPNMSSPPPRSMGPKGFPRGQSPAARKEHGGSGDSIRFSQPYSVPMYNLAASRYMSGDMRYMAGRLPFSIPTNSYHRAIRPYQTSYYPRPHSQPSGEALSLTRPPRVRKPTSPQTRSPARGPFVGREFKDSSKPPAVMKIS